jgi:8-oxo-dGTP pyrophosphatase MutT (NUDIX family)
VNTKLTHFLQQHTPIVEESAVWGNGTTPLAIKSYLSQDLPPLDFVTSVRAVVIRDDDVLVVRDPGGYHIIPGGQREADETLLQTLQRELQEETGWSLSNIRLIGFKHFHYLGPRLATFPIYPDFLQIIYSAKPEAFHPQAQEQNGYELEAGFRPQSELTTLDLKASDHAFLDAALHSQLYRLPEEI